MKLDATPQGRVLYEKLGFVSEYDIERWMLKREPHEIVTTEICRSKLRTCCGLIGRFSGLTGAGSCVL